MCYETDALTNCAKETCGFQISRYSAQQLTCDLTCMDSRKATQAPTLAPRAPTQHSCATQLMENQQYAGKHTGGGHIEAFEVVQLAGHMHANGTVRTSHAQNRGGIRDAAKLWNDT